MRKRSHTDHLNFDPSNGLFWENQTNRLHTRSALTILRICFVIFLVGIWFAFLDRIFFFLILRDSVLAVNCLEEEVEALRSRARCRAPTLISIDSTCTCIHVLVWKTHLLLFLSLFLTCLTCERFCSLHALRTDLSATGHTSRVCQNPLHTSHLFCVDVRQTDTQCFSYPTRKIARCGAHKLVNTQTMPPTQIRHLLPP